MKHVLDASALLAFVIGEPGAGRVSDTIPGAMISSVNLAETTTRLMDLGGTLESVRRTVDLLGLVIVNFDVDQAWISTELRAETRAAGLSIGDRACLALAMREGATALTADRAWARIDVDCKIELIR